VVRWIVSQFHGRRTASDPVEHASRTDRGELLTVANRDQLRTCALDQLGEGIETLVVDHPSLIENDRRIGTNMDGPRVRSGRERVERERAPVERRTVGSEPLGSRARDGDPDCFATCQLLRSCRGVDDDALACSRRADEHARTLRTSQNEQCHVLLVGERCADALCDLARRIHPRGVPNIASGGSGEYGCSSFDCLLLRADSERRHPAALKRQQAPIPDHLPRYLERFVWRQLASGLLHGDGVQVTQLEDGVTLGETFLDPILHRPNGWPDVLAGEQPQRPTGTKPVPARGVPPHVLKVGSVGELLCAAVLEREVAQLATLRRTTVASTKTISCPRNLPGTSREGVAQLLGDTCDLKILAVLPRRLLDRIPLVGEFLSERRAVKRTDLTRRTEHRPGAHSDDPIVLAHCARDDNVAVELRIGSVGS
jgi:hypothetical protein